MSKDNQTTVTGELRDWRRQFVCSEGTHVFWGFIYGDVRNRFPDGEWIHTAQVAKVVGNLVYTISGGIYRLIGKSGGPDVNPWKRT